MSSTTTVNAKIHELVAPIVRDLDLDLYDLEFNGGILRITVDTKPGSAGGVTLDQLSLVNRLVGRDLDHHDPIPGHYTLEVTSPGLERTLRTPAHFRREMGKTVNVRMRAGTGFDGPLRRVQGTLVAADDDTVTVRLDDRSLTEHVLPIDSIDRAKTVFVWEKGEKPGKPGAKPAKAGSKKTAEKTPGPSDELDPEMSDLDATEEVPE